ncbi:hypothetical protein R6Q59_016778 [Mikania micrantha]
MGGSNDREHQLTDCMLMLDMICRGSKLPRFENTREIVNVGENRVKKGIPDSPESPKQAFLAVRGEETHHLILSDLFSADVALEAARAAITGGISVLEIVVSTPGVFEVLHQLVQDFPTTTLGVGTVLNTKDAEKAKNAGAKFIMSPAIVKGILDQNSDDLLYIPGVMTPTEILSSYNAGAKIVKIYPVSAIGGAQYIATLKKPFPHIPIVVSQGITTDSVGAYIDEGASAVVLSDAIFDKKAVSQRNFSAIYELAQYAALQVNEAVKRKEKIFPGKFYENMRH